ncbi:hypothetical protein HJC23_013346 [Cyclotella cryptica]|uniref:Uncharacterized protein n=1 Tax=Cyclotella cryptica TaxID=29204 RepID=A0ABD3P9A7_9STRA
MMNSILARTGLRVAGRSLQRSQRRSMGDGPYTDAMHVKKNKYVEEWNGRREITEQTFEDGTNYEGGSSVQEEWTCVSGEEGLRMYYGGMVD